MREEKREGRTAGPAAGRRQTPPGYGFGGGLAADRGLQLPPTPTPTPHRNIAMSKKNLIENQESANGNKSRSKFVAYYRVSTARQGQSGLGLEGQQDAVRRLTQDRGGYPPELEFTEIESGKIRYRPKLLEAIAHCQVTGATLVVAKLDRLSRDARFLLELADSGIPILFGDMPELDATTSHGRVQLTMMAAFAEFERRRISERTKAALAMSKLRGTKLGGNRGVAPTDEHREAAKASIKAKTEKRATALRSVIQAILTDGPLSNRRIAEELNERGIQTPSGKGKWQATTVARVLANS